MFGVESFDFRVLPLEARASDLQHCLVANRSGRALTSTKMLELRFKRVGRWTETILEQEVAMKGKTQSICLAAERGIRAK
jgi:hypothetical protein